MHLIRRLHLPSRTLVVLLAALLAPAACDREITRGEATAATASPRATAYPGPGEGTMVAMNDHGDIIVTPVNSESWPYRWTRGGGQEFLIGLGLTSVAGINNSGVAVGSTREGSPPWRTFAAIWRPGQAVELVEAPPGISGLEARVVNDAGVVAGRAFVNDMFDYSFRCFRGAGERPAIPTTGKRSWTSTSPATFSSSMTGGVRSMTFPPASRRSTGGVRAW
jgi:hypothetical protein